MFVGRTKEGKSTRAVRRKVVLGIMFAIGCGGEEVVLRLGVRVSLRERSEEKKLGT